MIMGAKIGMLIVETIAKIRRAFFGQGKPIKAICRELGLSRKVVRKVVRSKATEFRYEREAQPLPKIGPWSDKLDQLLLANEGKEHDIFDSDDYFQFHGGMIATIRALTGRKPRHYFGDTHDPAGPAVRDLKQEALRVFRSRVVNPKWLEGITRHGYKGGLELAATVDYLFGYDATAGVVGRLDVRAGRGSLRPRSGDPGVPGEEQSLGASRDRGPPARGRTTRSLGRA